MNETQAVEVRKMAENHVDWFLEMVRPLMITEFQHGFKHGYDIGKGSKSDQPAGDGKISFIR